MIGVNELERTNEFAIFEDLAKNDHEQVVFCNDASTGLKAIIGIHNTILGPALGGTRMWDYTSDAEALTDVLRLARGMTYKAAISGLNLGGGKAVIIGRAFGNRVARCVAADYPEVTKAVVLIAAGGLVPIHKDIEHDFKKLISGNYSDDKELLELIQKTQFSPKSDAALYPRNSFYKEVGDAQWSTRLSTPYNDWWSAGKAPVLIIQGLDDLIAVPENGRILKMELGHRAELVEISDAGHSLYIEKPNEIVEAILEYLQTLN